jgi:hypothetical protein
MINHFRISFIIFVLASGRGLAQTPGGNELDSKYTPNSSSVFNNSVRKNNDPNGSADISFHQALKFSPTLLARQKVALFYERGFGAVTACLGLGKAFGKDILQDIGFTAFTDFYDAKVLAPGDIVNNSIYYGSGLYASFSMKVFFSGTAFDGGFVEFNYKKDKFSYYLNPTVDSRRITNGNVVDFTMNAFSFGYGYAGVSGVHSNITHEFFFNSGIKLFNISRFDKVDTNNGSGNVDMTYRRSSQDIKARLLPTLNIGYVFGFGF